MILEFTQCKRKLPVCWVGWFDVDTLHRLEDWDVLPFATMCNSGYSLRAEHPRYLKETLGPSWEFHWLVIRGTVHKASLQWVKSFHTPSCENSQAVSVAQQEQWVQVMGPWIFYWNHRPLMQLWIWILRCHWLCTGVILSSAWKLPFCCFFSDLLLLPEEEAFKLNQFCLFFHKVFVKTR